MNVKLPLLLGLLCFALGVQAQISHGGQPYSFDHTISTDAPSKVLPTVDVDAMKQIDAQFYTEKGRSIRFGEEFSVNYNLDNSGAWTTLPNGDRIWTLAISCPDAFHINLIYDQFYMPKGARFFIYNKERSHVLGEFNSGNNKSYGTFSTGLLRGDESILEYYEPATAAGQGKLSVSTVVHGYRNMLGSLEKGYGDSGSCNINVNCPEGAAWQTIKTSVAKIVNGGFDHCTGSMINNVNQDCTPYFLTAQHCAGGEQNWIFYFNWESPGCSNQNIPQDQSVSGGTRRAGLNAGDFELLELSSEPPVDFNAYYAGWNATNTPSPTSTCIHHPAGDIKKISFNTDPLVSGTFYGTPNTHWEVTEWEDGTTEGGSSGSALFDNNQRIVGMLTGGSASCFNTNGHDVYGKMFYNWAEGSSSTSRLRDWLDPDNTGVLVLDGFSCSNNSAVALNIENPVGEVCDLFVLPQVRVTNQGSDDLNSLTLEFYIDDDSPSIQSWSGSLTPGSDELVDLSQFATVLGNHDYTVCVTDINGEAVTDPNCQTVSFFCDELSAVKVSAKFILEGAKLSGNFMRKDLLESDLLPLQQPYNVAPYNYPGAENVASYNDFPASTVDWIYIQIRSAADHSVVLGKRAALLKSDGRIMDVDGSLGVSFPGLTPNAAYRIVIFHKSHLAVMSAQDVTLPNTTAYDFSTSVSKAAGLDQLKMLAGKAVMRSGEYNGDGTINFADFIGWLTSNNVLDDYLFVDGDCNGTINFFDFVLWLKNNNVIRFSEI